MHLALVGRRSESEGNEKGNGGREGEKSSSSDSSTCLQTSNTNDESQAKYSVAVSHELIRLLPLSSLPPSSQSTSTSLSPVSDLDTHKPTSS